MSVSQRIGHAVQAQAVLDERSRRPSRSAPGVTTAKRSSGGVIASRLSGSAKKAKTASTSASRTCSRRSVWMAIIMGLRMSDLRSAPVPPLRDDDHVRDGRERRAARRLLRRLRLPALRGRGARLREEGAGWSSATSR
jgi:hypothetical protein